MAARDRVKVSNVLKLSCVTNISAKSVKYYMKYSDLCFVQNWVGLFIFSKEVYETGPSLEENMKL